MMKQFLLFAVAKLSPGSVGVQTVDANNVVVGVLNTVYFFAGIAAIIVIIVAGIMYTTSSGDPAKAKQSREAIIYALVGLIIVMMAFVITGFVIGSF